MFVVQSKTHVVRQVPVSEFFNPELGVVASQEERDQHALDALRYLTDLPESLRRAAIEYFAAKDEEERIAHRHQQASIRATQARVMFEREFAALRPLPAVPHLLLFLEAGYAANVSPTTGVLHCYKLVVPIPTQVPQAIGQEVRDGDIEF